MGFLKKHWKKSKNEQDQWKLDLLFIVMVYKKASNYALQSVAYLILMRLGIVLGIFIQNVLLFFWIIFSVWIH